MKDWMDRMDGVKYHPSSLIYFDLTTKSNFHVWLRCDQQKFVFNKCFLYQIQSYNNNNEAPMQVKNINE